MGWQINVNTAIIALGILIINVLVSILDKAEYISLVQAIDMVLVPLVGGLMPSTTTINNNESGGGQNE